jgi:hypothetical protein
MKKTVLVLALSCLAFVSKAQLAIGASTGVNLFFAGVGAAPEVGILGEYGFKGGKYAARAAFNFYFPKSQSSTVYATSLNSSNNIEQITVPVTQKLGVQSISIGAKMYFGDGSIEDGGLYVGAGACLFLASVKTTYGAYDNTNYSIPGATSGSASYSQVMLMGNFGYEKGFDFGNLFAEIQLYVPATKVNGQDVTEINIPASVGLAIGINTLLERNSLLNNKTLI